MRTGASEIVGKTITGVIVKAAIDPKAKPQGQLFLIFDDNSSYEFYSYFSPLSTTGGLDKNTSFREVYSYMKERFYIEFHAVKDPDSDEVACLSSSSW